MGFSFYIGLYCLGILITNPFWGAKASKCPNDWLKKQGNCYGYFDEKLSWDDAEMECQSYGPGYHLASILSRQEAALVSVYTKDKQNSASNVWIGLRDVSEKGRWRWADESTFNYKSWAGLQPDHTYGNEHCVEMLHSTNFKEWNDRACEALNAYICKYQQ
ncbi:C-type lectin LmsL-like [Thamnophis elegans]|uniref:C-type lectin LmsL-like n=1 Tax=Thamnophis elegans TaxID=35005 RepID=UPI001379097E|nr:C-type lectin LmsL-like [Thamnophis elegans]